MEWFLSIDLRLVPLMQFVSSTALTVMSVTVAIVAAFVGYRNSNGWPPVLLAIGPRTGEGMMG